MEPLELIEPKTMTLKSLIQKHGLYAIGVVAVVVMILAGVFFSASVAESAVSFTTPTQPADTYKNFTFFSATTTTATSTNTTDGGGYFIVAGAKEVVMYFSRGGATGANTGSTNFKVQVSPDGSNWYDYSKLIQNAATSTDPTSLSSVTIAAATSTTITGLDMDNFTFFAVRCIAVETTDGDHTCKASAEF